MTTLTFDERLLSESDEHRLALHIEAGLLARRVLDGDLSWPQGAHEVELVELCNQGDRAYRRFVRANLRLVIMVTTPAALRTRLDADDLFQEGVLGLIEAVRRYDHRRGARFATFALPWIRMRVGECAVTRDGSVGLPASRAKAWTQVMAIRDALEVSGLRRPSLEAIAAEAGRPVAQVRALLTHAPASRFDDGEVPEVRGAPRVRSGDDLAVQRLLRRLGREERDVIERLYGLCGHPPCTHDEVADELGVSTSTVRRRERSALLALRCPPARGDAA